MRESQNNVFQIVGSTWNKLGYLRLQTIFFGFNQIFWNCNFVNIRQVIYFIWVSGIFAKFCPAQDIICDHLTGKMVFVEFEKLIAPLIETLRRNGGYN